MAITIVTLSNSRPELIRLQHKSILRHVTDSDVRFVVANNARVPSFLNMLKKYAATRNKADFTRMFELQEFKKKTERESIGISKVCRELGITELRVKESRRFRDSKSAEPSSIVAYSLKWLFTSGLRVVESDTYVLIDSDMFFIRDIALAEQLGPRLLAYIPQFRGRDVEYLWTGFFMAKGRLLEKMDFSLGVFRDQRTDVGGGTHTLVESLPIHLVSYLQFLNFGDYKKGPDATVWNCSINGNFGATFSIRNADKSLESFSAEYDRRHLADLGAKVNVASDEQYVEKFVSNMHLLERANFRPVNIDLIASVETPDSPFLLHYKNASNPRDFDDQTYAEKKRNWIQSILNRP